MIVSAVTKKTYFFLDSPSIACRCIALSVDIYERNTALVIDLDFPLEVAVTNAKWT